MMKRHRTNSLVAQILIIFVVFNTISLIFFTFYIFEQDRRLTTHNAEESLQEIANEKANLISLTMDLVSHETENLACWTEEYLIIEQNSSEMTSFYRVATSGAIYRSKNDADARGLTTSVFFPSDVELTPEVIHDFNATERLGPFFQRLDERLPDFTWSYVSTENGLLRCYPSGDMSIFMPDHKQKGDVFYMVANPENNPQRKTVWTKPYVDFLGTGWMVSSSHPIYVDDQFVGVASTDISLKTMQKEFLSDFRLGSSGLAFLVDKEGNVIYHADFMPSGKAEGETFLTNIITDTTFPEVYKNALRQVLKSGDTSGIVRYVDEQTGEWRTIAHTPIDGQPWILAIEISQEDYMAVNRLEPNNFVFFLVTIVVACILFSIFLYWRYSRPILSLVNRARRVAEGDFDVEESRSYHYTEVDVLSEAFNTMSTRIKEHTDHLVQKNKEIETILNSIGGLLMILNPQGEIVMLNGRGEELIRQRGYTDMGLKCHQLLKGSGDICANCKLREVISTGKPSHMRLALDGDIYYNEYYPIAGETQEVMEVVVYSRRVTNRVFMEKELAQTEKMAGIGQLSSAIAHELKNPLAVIKGYTYLLDVYTKKDQDERVKDAVSTISATVDEAERVIHTLLNFASRSLEETGPVNISQIVSQILLLSRRDIIRNSIEVVQEFEMEPLVYFGAAEPLKHIFQNLIGNAISAVKSGGSIHISGRFLSKDDKRILELEIRDDGPGVAPELRDKIFHPFFTTKEEDGTGLGLWITKIMVEKMAGDITLLDTDGPGAAFLIHLPENQKRGGGYNIQ